MTTTKINIPKDPLLNKLPPQNIEAEGAILSAVLINNDTLLNIVDILTPEHFYRSAHLKIFRAMLDLFSNSEPIDLITLSNLLKERGELEEVGGATYLAQLLDSIPMSHNAEHHAKIIRNKSALRLMITSASDIISKCYDESSPVDDTIDFAEKSIFEISEDKINPAFYSLDKLIDENIDTLEERQNNKSQFTGIPTGYTRLDQMTSGLQNSDLIILAARPAMGKTAFSLNLARNVAVDANVPVAVFSLEMSKDQLSMRLLTAEARVNSHKLKTGFLEQDDWNKITEAAGILSEAPIFIDDCPDVTVMDIRAKARRLAMDKKGLGLIIIDYLQLMKGRSGLDRHLEIAEISRNLKGLAKELNIPIIALSQLNRMLEQRSDKRPMLSDLRESGSLEQDADIVAFIYRDEVYNKEENNPNQGKAEIILAKHRNGAVGTAHMAFLGKYTRFEDLAVGDYPETF